jgi:hypothetical protein
MLHACVERFDVMCVRGNILGWEGEVNAGKQEEYKLKTSHTDLQSQMST